MDVWLSEKREIINGLDEQLLLVLSNRFSVIREIGEYKQSNNVSVMQPNRVKQVLQRNKDIGTAHGLRAEFIERLYALIIEEACYVEEQISMDSDISKPLVFCTLGPEDTCHANATAHYLEYQNIQNNTTRYILDFEHAVQLVSCGEVDFIIQNCAHPQVALLNEKYRDTVYIVDAFVFPTKPMGLLARKRRTGRSLALMLATKNYINLDEWGKYSFEPSNPIVAEKLLNNDYDYGISFLEYADTYSNDLEIIEDFGGTVDTAWIVFGKVRRNISGIVIGSNSKDYFNNIK